MIKESVYLGALVHDIGKLIERSKKYNLEEKVSDIRYAHAKYSHFFLNVLSNNIEWLKQYAQDIIDIAGYHHQPRNIQEKIVQLADWLASSEREKDEKNITLYNKVPLRSIFPEIFGNDRTPKFYELKPFNFNNIFPVEKEDLEISAEQYKQLLEIVEREFKRVQDKEDILFLLETYFSFIPAQTTKHNPDISLFDHLKLTAAIALCLYYQEERDLLTDDKIQTYLKHLFEMLTIEKKEGKIKSLEYGKKHLNDEHFVLIHGDLSGIQNYIFDIPSKGAGKSLKGRSVYLIILMEAISNYIVENLGLEKANIIYNGGGNFYILAPSCMENKICELRKNVNEILFEVHKNKLTCNIGFTKIKLFEFKDFKNAWKRAANETAKLKMKKFSNIWEEKYDEFFEPKLIIENNKFCSICHSTDNIKEDAETGQKLCSLCYSFEKLTDLVKNAKYIIISKNYTKETKITWKSAINKLGFNIDFDDKIDEDNIENTYTLNDFEDEKILKWKIGAFNLPKDSNFEHLVLTEQERKDLPPNIDLEKDARVNKRKLAYLKLDVDNLGSIFTNGLNNPSISRMTTVSKMMRIFFEGYLQHFIRTNGWNEDIYVVFAGGDDTFLIGKPEIVLKFIQEFRKEFSRFVGENPKIHFSAGFGIFGHRFPLIKATQITEDYLEKAKSFVYPENKDENPEKNKIVIFDEVFNWDEFDYILEIRDEIKRLVGNKEKHRRAVIQKIINSTKGFKPLLEQSQKGKIDMKRVWRLSYYLRDLKDEKNDIIKIYEDMWLKNMFKKPEDIKNHQIITVAAKLADLETRNKEENDV